MALSATNLGSEYGLTGEEMNLALVKLGFLQGSPGNYDLTSKIRPYTYTKDFGSWVHRTYDESIKDALNISNELISEVKKEIADKRAAHYAQLAAERAKASADFLAKQATQKTAELAKQKEAQELLKRTLAYKKAGKIGLIIAGTSALCYGVYKVTPKIQRWYAVKQRKNMKNAI